MEGEPMAGEPNMLRLTAEIVAAHLAKNSVAPADVPRLIEEVYRTLATVGQAEPPEPERPRPAVPIKRSVTPDYLVCLEDGRKLKALKRHLRADHNMTPDQYRERWGLPLGYPMVAPNYAARRSAMAREFGLGGRPRRRPAGTDAKPGKPSRGSPRRASKSG
jgi:predicted transcriptional regulator